MTTEQFDTLWLYRRLINWLDVYRWGIEHNFPLMFTPSSLHVSIATVRHATDLSSLGPLDTKPLTIEAGPRSVAKLGNNGAQCLVFESPELVARHAAIGTTLPVDHDTLHCHLTLCRHRKQTFEPNEPYEGPLVFGPEVQGRFVSNFKVSQRAVNGNDVRKLLNLPLIAGKSSNARSMNQEAQEAQQRQRKQARVREDLDDLLGDDPVIQQRLLRRL